MLIDRKVERYVEEVVSYVPAVSRGRAAKDVSEMVYDMIRDYAAGREPDILDARTVIRVLGSPEEIAATWMAANKDRKTENTQRAEEFLFGLKLPFVGSMSRGKALRYINLISNLLMVLAAVFVVVGLLAVGTHVIRSMLPVFIGCIFALLSVTGRGVLIRQY